MRDETVPTAVEVLPRSDLPESADVAGSGLRRSAIEHAECSPP